MVDDKMCCTTKIDKQNNEDLLLCRVSDEIYARVIEMDNVIPMQFSNKTMKGYVYITENGHKTQKDLNYWLQLCLDFNPFAKSSKK